MLLLNPGARQQPWQVDPSTVKQTNDTYPQFYLYSRIVGAKLFMDANFHSDIDLANIADEACFSKFHFVRLFKAIYGKTPHQYLIKVRIENAKEFLRCGYTVADTCYMVGFGSITSFAALFKKNEGATPSAFQQDERVRQEEIKSMPLRFIPNCFAEQRGWTKNSNFQELLVSG